MTEKEEKEDGVRSAEYRVRRTDYRERKREESLFRGRLGTQPQPQPQPKPKP
jgi:hypothetical protein